MGPQSVLISGVGVAGPALAHWLLHHGFRPTLVERSPQLRRGGYVIDFWGLGYELMERMGLLEQVKAAGYQVKEVRLVDAKGHRTGGFDAHVFRAATGGRFTSLRRGELSSILYGSIKGRAELLFGDSITALDDDGDSVLVHFERANARRFNLVIGADGLHSVVRRLVFGPDADFERFLGYVVAAFSVSGYAARDENIYLSHAVPGKTISRFSMREDRTMFLLVLADPQRVSMSDPDAQRAYLRERFSNVGWESPQILAALSDSNDLYFDRVSQVRMPRWSKGRVALVGDAAFAPSLLAGQGSALAIIAAYVLAGELARANSVDAAFQRYEWLLQSFLEQKQDAAVRFAQSFVPSSHLAIRIRNLVSNALAVPLLARLAMGRTLLDRLQLPDYGRVPGTPSPERGANVLGHHTS
jgi:2-polyprenyl-6-methoxyphenol hydroxylase-like FAD-dependent oxidoreductase